MRDEFSERVKTTLALRVGYHCSNPECPTITSGPAYDPQKSVIIGVAAHITAASPGGPRYDSTLSPEERKGPENGIWLCQSCAKLIDSDERRYTCDVLYKWKRDAEARALRSIEGGSFPTVGWEERPSVSLLANQVDHLAALLSEEADRGTEQALEGWREGRRDEAVRWVAKWKDDTATWLSLLPERKAKILCLAARLELDVGNIDRAEQLADEAKQLAPAQSQARLRALIARRRGESERALALLENEQDIESLNLKAALLLEVGRTDEGLAILSFSGQGSNSNDKSQAKC